MTKETKAILNETDTYGPTYMRIAERLGGYERTEEDAKEIVDLLDLPPNASVLDAGCGYGRFTRALSACRLKVTGVDISPAAIEEAELRSPGPKYVCADLLNPIPSGFDAVLSLYSSFGYGETREEDELMLERFHEALKADGQLLMQLSDLERSRHRLKTDEGVTIRITNGVKETLNVNFKTGMLHVRYELDGEIVDSRIRMYEADDLQQMVETAGFKDVERYGDYKCSPKRPEDRLVLLARA